MAVTERVSNASTLRGLLLNPVTLLTSEEARPLDTELSRSGGGRRGTYRQIAAIAASLAAVTFLSLVSLASTGADVVRLCCGRDWDPILVVFVLAWIPLVRLLAWQVGLAVRAWRSSR